MLSIIDFVPDEEIFTDYGQHDTAFFDSNSNYPYDDDASGGGDGYGSMPGDTMVEEFSVKDGMPIPLLQMTYINKTKPRPCDQEVTLYELNDERLYKPNKRRGKPTPVKGKLSNCHESECERPFSVQLIPHTNLILIVADKHCPCFSTKITIRPREVVYGHNNTAEEYCRRLKYNIYRRKPTHCFSYHPEETEIKLCGGATANAVSFLAAIVAMLMGFAARL